MYTYNYLQFKNLNNYTPTVAFDFYFKKAKINNKILVLRFYDISGDEIYSQMITNLYKIGQIFLFFYDAYDKNSFDRAKSYFEDIKNADIKNPIYILVRIKYEIRLNSNEKEDIVTDEEALEYAGKNNMHFYHIAIFVKYETGINKLIEFILKEYVKRNNI